MGMRKGDIGVDDDQKGSKFNWVGGIGVTTGGLWGLSVELRKRVR